MEYQRPDILSFCLTKATNSRSNLGVRIRGEIAHDHKAILSHDAIVFVSDLVRTFRDRVKYILQERILAQKVYDAGELPDFSSMSAHIRDSNWTCSPPTVLIEDRRVEITGPVERKMIINALNSGAKVFMADFEDSLSPTWHNVLQGQVNLRDAVNGDISYVDIIRNREYRLNKKFAVLFIRPRGWHLIEAHFEVDGEPAPASLVDFGLFVFHNGLKFHQKHGGSGPFFYLPKMEHSREAALWNDVFNTAEERIGIPHGSIRATYLIETLPAVFQMHEILYELRHHSAGLNCGRWDYIFSYIKTLKAHGSRLLPDRNQIGMSQHFLRSYANLLIKTCHKRGVHAMGGMAAQIPIKDDPVKNAAAFEKVRVDKLVEVKAGHYGTWAAHPGLVSVITDVFNEYMKTPNQLHRMREDVNVSADDLLAVPIGTRTLEGLRLNTVVGIQYLAAWMNGTGSVPLYNLMEDAATAEISRAQIWQWIHHKAILDGDLVPVVVTKEMFAFIVQKEVADICSSVGEEKFASGMFHKAAKLFAKQCTSESLSNFLTIDAYPSIVSIHPEARL